jgi:hypothetical protein
VFDGSCTDDLNSCPECDCTSVGGNEGWLADGWCDTINNNEVCGWDNGDCCPTECTDTVSNGCPENPGGCYAGDGVYDYCGNCTVCSDCGSSDNAAGGDCFGDGVGDGDDCVGADPCAEFAGTGDVSADGLVNVLDIVAIVNYILDTSEFDECQLASADLSGDGLVNVLDIVSIVNLILSDRSADAFSARLINEAGMVSIDANGFIGAVQMTLTHGADFSIIG